MTGNLQESLAMTTTLIVPGLGDSGPDHWQSWIELRAPGAVRAIQPNWHHPYLPHWSHTVARELRRSPGPAIVVAHSFGVLAAVTAADEHPELIASALLVAPADPEQFQLTGEVPQARLPYPSILVASRNDKWMSYEAAGALAEAWGSTLFDAGHAGHINPKSGYGPWPVGLALLDQLKGEATTRRDQLARRKDDFFIELGEI